MFTPPVNVLLAVSASVPGPALVNPAVPAITLPMETFFPSPSALTVIVGVVPAKVIVLPLRSQLAGVVAISVSPKTRLPIVRGSTTLIVVSPAKLMVLKSAVFPAPSATMPPCQLAVLALLQSAVPDVSFQVPLAAHVVDAALIERVNANAANLFIICSNMMSLQESTGPWSVLRRPDKQGRKGRDQMAPQFQAGLDDKLPLVP